VGDESRCVMSQGGHRPLNIFAGLVYLEQAADDPVQDVPLGFPAHADGPDQVRLALSTLGGSEQQESEPMRPTRGLGRRKETDLGAVRPVADGDHDPHSAALFAQVALVAVVQQNICRTSSVITN